MDARVTQTSETGAYGQAVWSWRPRRWRQVRERCHERRWLTSPGYTGESTEQAVSPSRRECSGAKSSIKSTANARCVLRCVAIRGGRYFSTT